MDAQGTATGDQTDVPRRTSTRRQKARASTIQEIKDAARAVLAEGGVGALTLTAVARHLEIVPSALYRYMANREELLGQLSVDAYTDLADTIESAVAVAARDDLHPVEQLRVAARTWRAWALHKPVDFALVFGPPLPGHTPTQIVLDAADRTGAVFSRLLTRAMADQPPHQATPIEGIVPQPLHPALSAIGPDIPTTAVFLSGWIRLQGHLCAEVFDNMPPLPAALRADLFELTINLLLHEAGLFTPQEPEHS